MGSSSGREFVHTLLYGTFFIYLSNQASGWKSVGVCVCVCVCMYVCGVCVCVFSDTAYISA